MYKLYREECPGFNPIRFGRPYASLEAACKVAARFTAAVFQVREVTPHGAEILRDVVREGRRATI